MDPIKEAFNRAKQDIAELKSQISSISQEIVNLKNMLKSPADNSTNQQTDNQSFQHISQHKTDDLHTNQQVNPTHNLNELDNLPLKDVISPNNQFSTGNRGVPTDRQTNQQTDRQTTQSKNTYDNGPADHFSKVSQLLNSLDNIKREVRLKFKKLTSQEMLVFSTIYQLEEQGFTVDYPILSEKLKLSESSIRDYTQKIIKKGIPISKIKENNKKILLSVSEDLKKIASLSTIIQLREI